MKNLKLLSKPLLVFTVLCNVASPVQAVWPFKVKSDITQQTIESLYDKELTQTNTALVFDVHDVVTRFSLKSALAAAWRMDFGNKVHFAKKTVKYFTSNKNPKRAFEGVALEDRLNDNRYVQQAVALMNPHVPKTGTVEILQKLQAQGYQVYGCSNIGERSYEYMKATYPQAFAPIIACRTSNSENGYRKKNNKPAYEEIMHIMKNIRESSDPVIKTPDYMLFVDDKRSNLELASSTSPLFKGLLFKNPEKLREHLSQLKIRV